ncbi:MAG: AAA family ATPase [Planctomycetota bacterium]|jgi:type II secretory pathway predicted ATPase ExeA|nr:AAA family ATPase [Planctomycetota bacterium]
MPNGIDYLEYWGLEFAPFADDQRPETFVPTASSIQALGRLRYALGSGPGIAGLYGSAGIGKTRVVKALLGEFSAAKWLTCYFPSPLATAADLLAALHPSGRRSDAESGGAVAAITEFLENRAMLGLPALLAVDDVQATRNPDFLELLRTLGNVCGRNGPALRLLLSGQPEMENRLRAASRLDSRLAAKAVLEPMTGDETKLYILARLKAAASSQGIFTKHAAALIVGLSGGVPRKVNLLSELALVIAFGLERKKVDPEVVEMAAADLELLPGDVAAFYPWPVPERPAKAAAGDSGDAEGETEDILAELSMNDGR